MSTSDIFQSIDDLPPDSLQKIIDRLEFRGADAVFVKMRDTYLGKIDLASCKRILDIGCGTGVITRALAQRSDFKGKIVGIDFSRALIDAARNFARQEGLSKRIEFRVGNSHSLDELDNSYDLVLAHTLVSHVSDPASVVADAARVVAPGGTFAIFDGDYASLTFGAGDPAMNTTVTSAILDTIVANPQIMRHLLKMLMASGFELVDFLPEVYAEAGSGKFFINMAASYVPMAVSAKLLAGNVGADWLAMQNAASDGGTFFGACNFYTYLARKPQ
ncbi:MAG: methyltransferase domain-containing protein [Hyphomicrobiales bacterium]